MRAVFSVGRDAFRELRLLNERDAILPLEPVGGAPVHAEITLLAIQGLGILSASLSGVRHGTAGRPADDDDLYLGMTIAGRSVARQARRDVTLTAGDGMLLSAREGFTMSHGEPVQFMGLRLSRPLLADHVDSVDAAVMRPMRRSTALAWLTRYLRSVQADSALDDPLQAGDDVQQLMVGHVYDIVGAAITSARESALVRDGLGIRAARLRAIKSGILANLDSSHLSVAAVAAQHRITPRYLHKLFEYDGITYSAFILAQRLVGVHRMLTDRRFAGRSISALAFDAGFGDLSHFNREFKRRYNATPSDVRHKA